jgi:hypothetical protein
MIRSALVLLLVATVPRVCAGPVEAAIIAAMKLSDTPSYVWTTDVEDDARSYTIGGRMYAGYAWVKLPSLEAISARLGRDADADVEAIFKGDTASVIRVGDRWKTIKELPAPPDYDDDYVVLVPASNTLVEANQDPFGNPGLVPVLVHGPRRPNSRRGFSNARCAVSPPHEELGIIVSSCVSLHVDDDVATGELADVGARLLLAPGNDQGPTPLAAAGRFKLWLQGGIVLRYELELTGIVQAGRNRLVVHQRSETRVIDVGATQFAVPDEARLKLDR